MTRYLINAFHMSVAVCIGLLLSPVVLAIAAAAHTHHGAPPLRAHTMTIHSSLR